MPAPLIRPAAISDLPAIAEIQRVSTGAAQWAESDYERLLLSGEGAAQCLAAEVGGHVTGFLVYQWLAAEEAEVLNLAVQPAERRRGIAKALLGYLLNHVASEVFLEVRAGNSSALKLYQQAGFQEVGRRGSYYRNPVEDAIIMRRGPGHVDGS